MGSSPAKQALEDFTKKIRVGDTAGVEAFLRQLSSARGPQVPADKVLQELRTLDLNAALSDGKSPLQLAAACGREQVLRLLWDTCARDPNLPDLDPNAPDSRQRTALHHACSMPSGPKSAQCVADLLLRKADPCIADLDGHTPLDLARMARCSHCVRTIEDKVKVWQGWCDHDEHVLLQLPNWRRRWLVVYQDRYPNTGSWRQASTVQISCYNCRTLMKAPAYAYRIQCTCCGASVAMTASMQLVLYDQRLGMPRAALPDATHPAMKLDLPRSPGDIRVKALEDAGLKSFASNLFEGKIRRALQSTTNGSDLLHGLTVKVLRGASGAVAYEHSFRVASVQDRNSLMKWLEDPGKASYQAACNQASPLQVGWQSGASSTGAAAGPWNCPQCTYLHTGNEAARTQCVMCGAERGVPGLVPEATQPYDLPEPSAPPLATAELAAGGQPAAVQPAQAVQAMAAAPAAEAVPIEATAPPADTVAPAATVSSAAAGSAEEDDSRMCVVCMERIADTAVVPCGHMCGCFQCMQGLSGMEGAECPMCRGPVEKTMRIFHN